MPIRDRIERNTHLSAGESQIIHVTAWTEREARSRCPSGCVAVFAARIRQGETYAQ
ncbi:host cell division inhibitor Icd-like protein [Shigella boydii]|nr:host cell division inhibitor Icd-like protein [Shigella boydii]